MGTMNEKQLPAESGSNPLDPPVPPAANWRQFGWLPCNLSLELPVAHFTVRELLRLAPSRIVPTQWSCGTEVPLRANGQLIGWAEFEPVGDHIEARITDLATTLQSSSSTTDDIANATNEVRNAYDQFNSARTFYGSTLDQLNASQDFLNSEQLQLTQQSSNLVGVDMNQAATNLTNAETARNAALQAAASAGNLSLFNYLGTSTSTI